MTSELGTALDACRKLIYDQERFVVAAHMRPDGDAVGATLAMGILLEELGKEVVFYNHDPVPYNFGFLPRAERWTTASPDTPDVTIILDCGEPGRIGPVDQEFWGRQVVVIDHHKTFDPDFADLYVRDVSAAATGEIIYRLAKRFGVMTSDLAHALYCCLMTDTGSFRYSNTSRETFTIAGELIDAGVDAWHMTSHIYESQPRERIDLLCKVLETLSVSDDGKLAFLRIERATFDGVERGDELIDGFINYARSIRGVEVATQLVEMVDGTWKISFRSRGNVDVSQLASRFGGGGHRNAAGCTMTGAPTEIEGALSGALVELLNA
jgi:phosphoesterase RecJ-like protein